MPSVIDLNDIGVFVEAEGQQLTSPGYALLQRDEAPVLGEIALHQSRLAPAKTANRFWRDLSLNPVGIAHPQVRHQADLVWHHVKQIHSELSLDQGVFLCPSHYSEEQLSLFGGILNAQQIRPAALVKRALAAAVLEPEASAFIEVQLHQILVTSLGLKDGERIADDTRIIAADGYLGLVDILLKAIQKRFIHETRFDPLHHASTEQQLADALPNILGHLSRSETTLALVQSRDDEYRAEIRREDLAPAIASLWVAIRAALPEGGLVLADQSIALFPGFESLQRDWRLLSSQQLAMSVRSMPLPASDDEDMPVYLTRVGLTPNPDNLKKAPESPKPAQAEALETEVLPAVQSSEAVSRPTHLLCRGVAIRRQTMWLGISAEGRIELLDSEPQKALACCVLSEQGMEINAVGDIQLNGEKLVGRRLLSIADHISANDIPGGFTAIQVVGDDR